jgi:hypothetical protein
MTRAPRALGAAFDRYRLATSPPGAAWGFHSRCRTVRGVAPTTAAPGTSATRDPPGRRDPAHALGDPIEDKLPRVRGRPGGLPERLTVGRLQGGGGGLGLASVGGFRQSRSARSPGRGWRLVAGGRGMAPVNLGLAG